MKRMFVTLALLAAAILAAPAAAQQPVEYWANDGHSRLVLGIKMGRTGQYLVNVNEAWCPIDQATFAAEDEYGRRADVSALHPPFRAKIQYRLTGDEGRYTRTIIGLKVIEQYGYNENRDIVRPGHEMPIGLEDRSDPVYNDQLLEKERAR